MSVISEVGLLSLIYDGFRFGQDSCVILVFCATTFPILAIEDLSLRTVVVAVAVAAAVVLAAMFVNILSVVVERCFGDFSSQFVGDSFRFLT